MFNIECHQNGGYNLRCYNNRIYIVYNKAWIEILLTYYYKAREILSTSHRVYVDKNKSSNITYSCSPSYTAAPIGGHFMRLPSRLPPQPFWLPYGFYSARLFQPLGCRASSCFIRIFTSTRAVPHIGTEVSDGCPLYCGFRMLSQRRVRSLEQPFDVCHRWPSCDLKPPLEPFVLCSYHLLSASYKYCVLCLWFMHRYVVV